MFELKQASVKNQTFLQQLYRQIDLKHIQSGKVNAMKMEYLKQKAQEQLHPLDLRNAHEDNLAVTSFRSLARKKENISPDKKESSMLLGASKIQADAEKQAGIPKVSKLVKSLGENVADSNDTNHNKKKNEHFCVFNLVYRDPEYSTPDQDTVQPAQQEQVQSKYLISLRK